MCSSTQPKMFGGAMPLGTGGNMPLPTTYQANAAPTANVGFTPPPPAPTPVNGSPAVATGPNPGANPISSPYQQWAKRMGNGFRGNLPSMKPGGAGGIMDRV